MSNILSWKERLLLYLGRKRRSRIGKITCIVLFECTANQDDVNIAAIVEPVGKSTDFNGKICRFGFDWIKKNSIYWNIN